MSHHLAALSKLPSMPTAAIQLMNMFSDPDVGIHEIVEVVQADPALAGKVLKAANTSRSGVKRQVSDLHRAVGLLGKKTVMALALGFSLSEASMSYGPHAQLYSDFWFQSLVRAVSASVLSERFRDIDPGEAFTVGLLARIGRLALLNNDSERFVPALVQSMDIGVPLAEIESEQAVFSSSDVTLHLLHTWNLPAHCIQAVDELEVTLDAACQNQGSRPVTLVDVLRLATAFAEFFSGESCGLAIARVYELAGSVLGEDEEGVHQLVDRIRSELDQHGELFRVDMSQVGSPLELLTQALEQLSILAVSPVAHPHEDGTCPRELQEENGRLRKRVMELTRCSTTDGLTSLYNRGYFLEQLRQRVRQADERCQPVGLLVADIDHFKQFNDVHGHLAGDEVLRSVAAAMRSCVRKGDVLARYGGEEFVMLSDVSDFDQLRSQAERLRRNVENLMIPYGRHVLAVTLSVGGALLVPLSGSSRAADSDGSEAVPDDALETDLFKQADAALYQSKSNGRNCVTIADAVVATHSQYRPENVPETAADGAVPPDAASCPEGEANVRIAPENLTNACERHVAAEFAFR